MNSEVVRFRQQQALEEESAQQALSGFAIVADHESITARMERDANKILQLFHEGKRAEALAAMEKDWAA